MSKEIRNIPEWIEIEVIGKEEFEKRMAELVGGYKILTVPFLPDVGVKFEDNQEVYTYRAIALKHNVLGG